MYNKSYATCKEFYKTVQKINTYDMNSDLNRSSWNAVRIGLNKSVPIII